MRSRRAACLVALALAGAAPACDPAPPADEGWPSAIPWPEAPDLGSPAPRAPSEGDARVIATPALPRRWDPAVAEGAELEILRHLHGALTTLDAHGDAAPDLAEAWISEDEGRRWIFTLRKDAQWSDGAPITADQLVARWLRIINPRHGSPHAWRLSAIDGVLPLRASPGRWSPRRRPPPMPGVTALDPQVIQIDLARPAPDLPILLAHPALGPDRADLDPAAPPQITSGRYRLGDLGDQLSLVARRPGDPDLRYAPISDPRLLADQIALGAVDDAGIMRPPLDQPAPTGPAWRAQPPRLIAVESPAALDPALRRALSLAIDRDALLRHLPGASAPALEMAPPPPYTGDAPVGFAPRRAKAALPPGSTPIITLYRDPDPTARWLAEALADMWRRHLGAKVTIAGGAWAAAQGGPGIALALSAEGRSLRPPLAQLMTRTAAWHAAAWADHPLPGLATPATQALIEGALAAPDPQRRAALADEARLAWGRDHLIPLLTQAPPRR